VVVEIELDRLLSHLYFFSHFFFISLILFNFLFKFKKLQILLYTGLEKLFQEII